MLAICGCAITEPEWDLSGHTPAHLSRDRGERKMQALRPGTGGIVMHQEVRAGPPSLGPTWSDHEQARERQDFANACMEAKGYVEK